MVATFGKTTAPLPQLQLAILESRQENIPQRPPQGMTGGSALLDRMAREQMHNRRLGLLQMIEREEGQLKVKLIGKFAWNYKVSVETAYRYYGVMLDAEMIAEEETELGMAVYTAAAMAEINKQQRQNELNLQLEREADEIAQRDENIRTGLEHLSK